MSEKQSIDTEIISGKKQATYFTDKHLIDKNKEIRAMVDRESHSIEKILWMSKTGIGYAAVKDKKTEQVWGMVVDIKIEGDTFSYQMTPESKMPENKECPIDILKKLTPTNDPNALKWRDVCYEAYHELKHKQTLNKLPLGTAIQFINTADTFIINFHEVKKGQTVELIKKRVGCLKESAWYMGNIRWTKEIPRGYEVSGKKRGLSR